jgi:hypothetical protein
VALNNTREGSTEKALDSNGGGGGGEEREIEGRHWIRDGRTENGIHEQRWINTNYDFTTVFNHFNV